MRSFQLSFEPKKDMTGNLTVSVGIFTYNRNDDLRACLQALSVQTYQDFDIIVVNGGDPSGVREVAKDFRLPITVVDQVKKGLVEARNLAWQKSNSDIVCLIDDDLVVSPGWLAEIRKTFLEDENIGGVSGPTIIPHERRKSRDLSGFLETSGESRNILWRLVGGFYKSVILENKMYDVGKILASGAFTPGSNFEKCLSLSGPVEVDYLEACHMCFRRLLVKKAGGFNYLYTGVGEWAEPELAFRVKDLGVKLIFNPRAVTEHHISQGGVFSARTNAYGRSRNFIAFYFKNIKPNTLNKIYRFSMHLIFINAYWIFKFFQTGNADWLTGITGTCTGLGRAMTGAGRSAS